MKKQTYKAMSFIEALLPTIKKLSDKHKNPINYLKTGWAEIAPDWARLATPYMIRNNTIIMKTNCEYATILQYREQELISIIKTILGDIDDKMFINYIKIIKQ